jgi:hypothetical protein
MKNLIKSLIFAISTVVGLGLNVEAQPLIHSPWTTNATPWAPSDDPFATVVGGGAIQASDAGTAYGYGAFGLSGGTAIGYGAFAGGVFTPPDSRNIAVGHLSFVNGNDPGALTNAINIGEGTANNENTFHLWGIPLAFKSGSALTLSQGVNGVAKEQVTNILQISYTYDTNYYFVQGNGDNTDGMYIWSSDFGGYTNAAAQAVGYADAGMGYNQFLMGDKTDLASLFIYQTYIPVTPISSPTNWIQLNGARWSVDGTYSGGIGYFKTNAITTNIFPVTSLTTTNQVIAANIPPARTTTNIFGFSDYAFLAVGADANNGANAITTNCVLYGSFDGDLFVKITTNLFSNNHTPANSFGEPSLTRIGNTYAVIATCDQRNAGSVPMTNIWLFTSSNGVSWSQTNIPFSIPTAGNMYGFAPRWWKDGTNWGFAVGINTNPASANGNLMRVWKYTALSDASLVNVSNFSRVATTMILGQDGSLTKVHTNWIGLTTAFSGQSLQMWQGDSTNMTMITTGDWLASDFISGSSYEAPTFVMLEDRARIYWFSQNQNVFMVENLFTKPSDFAANPAMGWSAPRRISGFDGYTWPSVSLNNVSTLSSVSKFVARGIRQVGTNGVAFYGDGSNLTGISQAQATNAALSAATTFTWKFRYPFSNTNYSVNLAGGGATLVAPVVGAKTTTNVVISMTAFTGILNATATSQ